MKIELWRNGAFEGLTRSRNSSVSLPQWRSYVWSVGGYASSFSGSSPRPTRRKYSDSGTPWSLCRGYDLTLSLHSRRGPR